MSADEIGNAFINHFYTTLNTNPAALAGLYQPGSSLTFEGTKVDGSEAIVQKYSSLGPISHNLAQLTKDIQVGPNGGTLIIFVTGQLKIGGQANPLQFSQVFNLVSTSPGQYYVHNEVFRLIYA